LFFEEEMMNNNNSNNNNTSCFRQVNPLLVYLLMSTGFLERTTANRHSRGSTSVQRLLIASEPAGSEFFFPIIM
jgi:hypothetical protein